MFTGIVTDIGTIIEFKNSTDGAGECYAKIATSYPPDSIAIGASIAHAGVCLTVIDKGSSATGHWFGVEVSQETLSVTTANTWAIGARLNLERALKAGDELGGHIVSGHVDGLVEIINIENKGESKCFTFEAPQTLTKFIAPKGSVTLDGTSLTVNEVADNEFNINVIPHTQSTTTWGAAQIGDKVNLEIDMLARYVERILNSQPKGE